jgi:hypothetical protein
MLNAHFKPLHQWHGPRTETRKDGTFRSSWVQTLDLLEFELGKLRAKDIVIQIEDPGGIEGIRNDGTIRMVSKNYWPGKACVVLSFESPKGSISMPCDRYEDWKDNLRAIALSLEALRAVDRYGVTRGNEQYRGWTQIGNGNGKMSREVAIALIASLVGANAVTLDQNWATVGEAMLKRAKKLHHPDAPGGSHETFVAIGQAEEVLCG